MGNLSKAVRSLNITENLRSYITNVMVNGNWNKKDFGSITLVYIDTEYEQLFNYFFFNKRGSLDGLSKDEMQNVLDMRPDKKDLDAVLAYCKDKKLDVAIPLDGHMKDTIDYVISKGAVLASSPWKAFMNLKNASCDALDYNFKEDKSFHLKPVNTEELLEEYDYVVGKVFGHGSTGIACQLLRSLVGKEFDSNQKTQFFLAKYNKNTVGACGLHLDENKCAGFYSDSIFKEYRGRDWGKHLVLNRIRAAKDIGAESSIAQCISNYGGGLYLSMGYSDNNGKLYHNLYNYLFRFSQ